MAEESVFLCYVRHIFKNWVGFQTAIDAGMGGPYAKEKEVWLGVQVENYFKQYENVKPAEIEEYLGEMLENEFDTYFEDGSLAEVSSKFCCAYGLSLSNPNDEIFREMREVKVSSSRTRKISKSEECEKMVSSVCSVTNEIENLSMNEEDDGWTTVSHKRHK
ncbi:pre-rRNA-processing protein TSR2 homolog [Parasteatoda tepidariorum]|uniref:pre-rRNA-processing protein TSR2 homolog n=1 Tax=Parasteatoda tepidariorum TaxID=114398 RepID=UPI001C718F17|nr:pre-rRNA-processing protein TSR2 homolog isoform X1 [Parasteatoda tepidariorum]